MKRFQNFQHAVSRLLGIAAMTVMIFSAAAPVVSHAAGLVICGSESGAEYQDAQAVNKSGGNQADLDKFNTDSCQFNQLLPEVIHIINFLIGTVGLIAVAWIIFIALQMVIALGDGAKIKKLQGDLTSVIIGLVMVMLAFVFVNTLYNIFNIQINGAKGFSFNPFNQ